MYDSSKNSRPGLVQPLVLLSTPWSGQVGGLRRLVASVLRSVKRSFGEYEIGVHFVGWFLRHAIVSCISTKTTKV